MSGAGRGPGPHFLGIGAIKSGTTWLHEVLGEHPDVWLPPIKELRYFDQPEVTVRQRLLDPDRGRHVYWLDMLRGVARHPRTWLRPPGLPWYLRYFFGRRGPAWYRSLFRPAGHRLAGDVTPLYAPLGEAAIARVARELPEVKLVYLLRDPVDRAWAHIVMRCMGLVDRRPERLTPELVRRTVEERDLADRWLWRVGRYAETLERWERFFPADRIFVGFYDELAADPAALLARIQRFLGLAEHRPAPERLARRYNRRPRTIALPPDLEAEIARRLLPDLGRLAERFGSPVDRWLERAERAAGAAARVQ